MTELARSRGTVFDQTAKGVEFARAALIDPAFKARLTETHRRLDVWRVVKGVRPFLQPIAPDLRDLEREVEVVLSAWRGS